MKVCSIIEQDLYVYVGATQVNKKIFLLYDSNNRRILLAVHDLLNALIINFVEIHSPYYYMALHV